MSGPWYYQGDYMGRAVGPLAVEVLAWHESYATVVGYGDGDAPFTVRHRELHRGNPPAVEPQPVGPDQLPPHPFEGITHGVADRPCTRPGCGRADRDPIHSLTAAVSRQDRWY
jgi:hypothetical protein